MASKQKKTDRRPASAPGDPRQEVERLFTKGWLKDAVKEAKLYHRDQPSADSHRLLERAYWLRADELRRNAMPAAAAEVAHHLFDFGVTDPELIEPAAGLAVALGMTRAAEELSGRIDSPEARERLALEAADQAVLHPERAAHAPAALRAGAAAVRQALDALQAHDGANALDVLRDVSRGSPFADWRLFVRGLAARYRGDHAEAQANWDRLDPRRAPSRIVRALPASAGPPTGAALEVLEKQLFGGPILGPLDELGALLAEGDWDGALRRVPAVRMRLRRVDPKLAERFARTLYERLIQDLDEFDEADAEDLVRAFLRAAEPIPIDPRWNRFRALVAEGPHGYRGEAEEHWRAYVKDIKSLSLVAPGEQAAAEGLVLAHLGKRYRAEAEDLAPPSGPAGPPPGQARFERDRATACLEESLRVAPELRDTYITLVAAYNQWQQPEKAADVARRLLERFPDDCAALEFLACHHVECHEPQRALPYIQRARAVKPLDPTAAQHEWLVRTMLSRHLAIEGRLDEAEAELDEAERARPSNSQSLSFRACRVILALAAGDSERARELQHAIQESLTDAAPLWLALTIEASLHKLPKAERDRFEVQWLTALSKKVRGDTAGALAELASSYRTRGVAFPGWDALVKQVLEYVGRATRVKYARAEDLERVCVFLSVQSQKRALSEKLIARGLKLFPKSPIIQSLAGAIAVAQGPFAAAHARLHFVKGLEYARASARPEDAALVPKLEKQISRIDDLLGTFPRIGSFAPGPRSFQAMMDALAERFGLDEAFDDDEPTAAPPAPGGGKKNSKRKG